jgi:hypothetical protein
VVKNIKQREMMRKLLASKPGATTAQLIDIATASFFPESNQVFCDLAFKVLMARMKRGELKCPSLLKVSGFECLLDDRFEVLWPYVTYCRYITQEHFCAWISALRNETHAKKVAEAYLKRHGGSGLSKNGRRLIARYVPAVRREYWRTFEDAQLMEKIDEEVALDFLAYPETKEDVARWILSECFFMKKEQASCLLISLLELPEFRVKAIRGLCLRYDDSYDIMAIERAILEHGAEGGSFIASQEGMPEVLDYLFLMGKKNPIAYFVILHLFPAEDLKRKVVKALINCGKTFLEENEENLFLSLFYRDFLGIATSIKDPVFAKKLREIVKNDKRRIAMKRRSGTQKCYEAIMRLQA